MVLTEVHIALSARLSKTFKSFRKQLNLKLYFTVKCPVAMDPSNLMSCFSANNYLQNT
jgi:hypothetical protein